MESRWLAKEVATHEETRRLREALAHAQAEAADCRQQLGYKDAEREAEQRRAATRLAMSEQAGGARAAALLAEIERMRNGAEPGARPSSGRALVAAAAPASTAHLPLSAPTTPPYYTSAMVGSASSYVGHLSPRRGGAIDARATLARLIED